MKKRFSGQVAIVTGGARGIGAATSRRLAAEGAIVVIADVLGAEGSALATEIQLREGRAVFEHLDVASEPEWKRAVDRADTMGRFRILVNNAGIARGEDLETETQAGFEKLTAINQVGPWLGMKAAAASFRRNGGGSVVNVSSIYGASGGTGTSFAYHASKGALRLMTKNAAIHFAKEGIRVNSVHPGFIDTPMVEPFTKGEDPAAKALRDYIQASTPMARMGKPEEIASVIAFLASDDASYVTGSELYADGGFTAA